jgi:menaquinone-9 beta-reductase
MDHDTLKHDVLIVGGGPSGLSTALHLQRIAPHLTSRILLLEKEHYPRLKLCAGGLTLDAEIILERLGLDVNEVPHVFADDIHFDFESRGLTIRVPGRHALRVIRRDEFDNWLAKKAESRGIKIRQGMTVKNILPTGRRSFRRNRSGNLPRADRRRRGRLERHHAAMYLPQRPSLHREGTGGFDPQTIPVVATSGKQSPGLEEIAALPSVARNDKQAYFEFSPVPDNIAGYIWDFPTQVKGESMRCWGIYDTNLLAGETVRNSRRRLQRRWNVSAST